MNKLTANDIASEAGVSLATVDRVLNDRPWARENTALRVPMVRNNIAHLKAQGIPVVTLVADQPMSEREHFIGVDSVDVAAGRVEEAGGKIVVPKMPIPGVGYVAYFIDTEGNTIGIYEDDSSAG